MDRTYGVFSLGRVWLGRINEGLGLSLGTKKFLKLTGGLICSNGIISHSKYKNVIIGCAVT